jgi:hypothetical protein
VGPGCTPAGLGNGENIVTICFKTYFFTSFAMGTSHGMNGQNGRFGYNSQNNHLDAS